MVDIDHFKHYVPYMISWLAERLLASQKGLCTMKLVTWSPSNHQMKRTEGRKLRRQDFIL